jgi:hypothetical protein
MAVINQALGCLADTLGSLGSRSGAVVEGLARALRALVRGNGRGRSSDTGDLRAH